MRTIKFYYTDKEYKQLLSHVVVLQDTREKSAQHIADYFTDNKIPCEKKALKTGDYSFKITACPKLGFMRDTYFTDELCIERKNSVSELAGNLCEKDNRIFKEFSRMSNIKNCYILIEDDSIDDILESKYESKLNPLSFMRTVLTVQKKSGFYLNFVNKKNIGNVIWEIIKNTLDNDILK